MTTIRLHKPLGNTWLGITLPVDVRPTIDEKLLPQCPREGCPSYDGKRCDVTGAQPYTLCEPAVQVLVNIMRSRPEGVAGLRAAPHENPKDA